MTVLSGYRLMWMFAFFDLPVLTKSQRREATRFRNHLLDLGFEMVQFSVYVRHCSSKERVEALVSKIRSGVPEEGKVKVLSITDKQFGNIVHLGGKVEKSARNGQLTLF